jgi:hypothetical protein
MSFTKLISRTADAGSARYTLSSPGELNPVREYYWRVRAQDSKGVWGEWSKTWKFTPRGPAYPLDVTLQFDSDRNVGTLRWSPNPKGRKPAAYRVYASDEKGFSVSDEPYNVTIGVSKDLPSKFSANFAVETKGTELQVIGADLTQPGANRAFYRVVAVDAAGKRSGPSEYVAAPRPAIVSKPIVAAKKGSEYLYTLATIRSLGDLRMRFVGGRETMSFWDIEQPKFRLERGPEWLKIDETTGRLFGIPASAGKAEVVVAVSLERPLRKVNEERLKWGQEQVVSTGTDTVGTSTQAFTIEVSP